MTVSTNELPRTQKRKQKSAAVQTKQSVPWRVDLIGIGSVRIGVFIKHRFDQKTGEPGDETGDKKHKEIIL